VRSRTRLFGTLRREPELYALLVSGALYSAGLVLRYSLRIEGAPVLAIFILVYLLVGSKIIKMAARSLVGGNPFNENFLLTIATLGAFAIGEYPEAVGVMLFFRVGEYLQDLALARSRRSIKSLLSFRAEYANLKVGDELRRVKPENVRVGDVIVVRPGERIPLDGVVIKGTSAVDMSPLTGESVPKAVEPGDEVLSGAVNLSGLLEVRVVREYRESTAAKILSLVERASARKARVEKFITRFARYYTPAVVSIAFAVALLPPLFTGSPLGAWAYRALVLLVISCPCALVLSVPLSYFGGLGRAAREGVLVKGSNFLDQLASLKVVAFDKTGTLTKGVFRVVKVCPKNGFGSVEVLRLAALAESYSNHPIAQAIRQAWRGEVEGRVEEYEEIAGQGVRARIGGVVVMVGNDRLLHREGVKHDVCDVAGGTVVHVVVNDMYAGYLLIRDEVKEEARNAIHELRKLGVRRVVMLTGDSRHVAKVVAEELGLDEYYAELLPSDKVRLIGEMCKKGRGPVAFVGDGVNDAPVIARADVGIAMGALGSDAAIEVADVVVMDDKLTRIPKAIEIARRTRRIAVQNIALAVAVKVAVLALGAVGRATMWEALFADVGVALITVLNSMRVLKS